MTPGSCDNDFKSMIYQHVKHNSGLDTRCEGALTPMPQTFTNEKSAMSQTIWWREVTSQSPYQPIVIQIGVSIRRP